MSEITITITTERQMAGLAYLFDREGFPVNIHSDIGGVHDTGYIIVGIHSVERLRIRFDEIIALLEKIRPLESTVRRTEQ